MSCKEIDMAAYKRRAHFDYFRSLAYPYAGVTVEVDISRLVPTLKMHSLPFFLPVPSPADSNPRITWGKYFERCGNVYLPVSVLCHHALVDGLHIGRFYAALDREISRLCDEIEGKNQA